MFAESTAVLRAMPRTFRILLAGVVVNRVATFIFPFLSIGLTRDRGLSPAEAGLVLLAFGAGNVASLLVGGLLTDAFGRRRTILASLFGGGALAVAMGFTEGTPAFVALLLIYGFVADLYRPAVHAVVADLLPPARRAAGIAALRTAVNLGFAVGVSLGGLLADLGPRVLFVGDGLTTAAFGVVVLLGIPETRSAAAPAEPFRPGLLPRAVAGDAVLRGVLLATFAWSLFIVSLMTVFPLTVTERAGYPSVVYGLVIGLNGLLVALFQMHVERTTSRFRRLRVAAAGMLLGGAALSVLPAMHHWAWFLGIMGVYTLGEMLVLPATTAFLADWAPPEVRGTYMGLHQSIFSLALAFGPVTLLPLRRFLGDGGFWPLFVLVAIPAALLLRRLDRDADRPELLRGAA